MKRFFTLLLLSLATVQLMGQITFSEMPAIGDSVFYRVINKNTFDPLPAATGVGVTWDYSNCFEKADTMQYLYVDPATTVEADSFPTSEVAEAIDGVAGHFFFSHDATSFYRDGIFDASLIIMYTNKLRLCKLPFEFGDDYTDAYAGTGWMVGLPNPAFIDDGSYFFEVQGVGTLRLPTGYWDSVFRVYYEEEFSIKTDIGTGAPIEVLSVTEYGYEYWKAGVTKPILTYYNTTIDDMMGGHSVEESVRYQKKLTPDGTNPIGIAEMEVPEVSVYPNPASGQVNVSMEGARIAQVELIDILGKSNYSKMVNTAALQLDVSGLNRGMYFIRITDQNGELMTRKLILD